MTEPRSLSEFKSEDKICIHININQRSKSMLSMKMYKNMQE